VPADVNVAVDSTGETIAVDTWYEIGVTSNATRDTLLYIDGI
jgi:hypothetical protein